MYLCEYFVLVTCVFARNSVLSGWSVADLERRDGGKHKQHGVGTPYRDKLPHLESPVQDGPNEGQFVGNCVRIRD